MIIFSDRNNRPMLAFIERTMECIESGIDWSCQDFANAFSGLRASTFSGISAQPAKFSNSRKTMMLDILCENISNALCFIWVDLKIVFPI